jgi:hypothetical protein
MPKPKTPIPEPEDFPANHPLLLANDLTKNELICLGYLGKKLHVVNNRIFNQAIYKEDKTREAVREGLSKLTEMVLVAQRGMIDQVKWLKDEGRKVIHLLISMETVKQKMFSQNSYLTRHREKMRCVKIYFTIQMIKEQINAIFRTSSKNWTSSCEQFSMQTSVLMTKILKTIITNSQSLLHPTIWTRSLHWIYMLKWPNSVT